jgi:hypothetical protein
MSISSNTKAIDDGKEAVAQPPVLAGLTVIAQHKAIVAVTSMTTGDVAAPAILTDVWVEATFVDVVAFVCPGNLDVSFRADAHEGTHEVLASIWTIVGSGFALEVDSRIR